MASDVATAGEAGAEVTKLAAGQAANGDQNGPAASDTVTPAPSAPADRPQPRPGDPAARPDAAEPGQQNAAHADLHCQHGSSKS